MKPPSRPLPRRLPRGCPSPGQAPGPANLGLGVRASCPRAAGWGTVRVRVLKPQGCARSSSSQQFAFARRFPQMKAHLTPTFNTFRQTRP